MCVCGQLPSNWHYCNICFFRCHLEEGSADFTVTLEAAILGVPFPPEGKEHHHMPYLMRKIIAVGIDSQFPRLYSPLLSIRAQLVPRLSMARTVGPGTRMSRMPPLSQRLPYKSESP